MWRALRVAAKHTVRPARQFRRERSGQRRRFSFFDDLKKTFQEEVSKNKELKEAAEQAQESWSKLGKATKDGVTGKTASESAQKAKKTASESAEKAKEAAAESKQRIREATKGTAERAEKAYTEASSKVKENVEKMSGTAADHAKKLKEKAEDSMGFVSGVRDKLSNRASKIKEDAYKAIQEDIETIKKSEEFQKIQEEVSTTTSKVAGIKEKLTESKAIKDEGSMLNIVANSVRESLGDSSWSDEFKALFKPEKKVKKIKLTGVAKATKQKSTANAPDTEETSETYDGPNALVKVDQPKTGWDAFAERLSNTPLISRLLEQSREANKKIGETSAGQAVKGAADATRDMRDELRERWETSQNPWVYRLSGWHDTFFAETETSQAIREVQRLDPDFEIEEFLQALQEETLPGVIQSFVNSDNDGLRDVLSEGAYAMTYAAIKTRVAEGHIVDPTILHLEEPTLVLAQVMEKMPPVFLVRSLAHQVNCIRNQNGEVTEGSPSEIRTVIYMMAFQQEVDDEMNELTWKIVEFAVHPLEARLI